MAKKVTVKVPTGATAKSATAKSATAKSATAKSAKRGRKSEETRAAVEAQPVKLAQNLRAVESATALLPKGYKPKAADRAAAAEGGATVVSVVLDCLRAASKSKPTTKAAILAALIRARPDKNPAKLAETVSVLLPRYIERSQNLWAEGKAVITPERGSYYLGKLSELPKEILNRDKGRFRKESAAAAK
jgi:hypothetical protein